MTSSPKTNTGPRVGWRGALDGFIGPDATNAELWVQFTPAVIAAVVAPWYAVVAHEKERPWTRFELFMIGLLALDFVGGVLTNATSAAKRWYHRPGQGLAEHMKFVCLHLLHIATVTFLFRRGDLRFLVGVSLYLLFAATVILSCPRYLQRPIALGLYMIVLVADRYVVSPTVGLEWFLSFFFLKLLISHLLHETAWNPTD